MSSALTTPLLSFWARFEGQSSEAGKCVVRPQGARGAGWGERGARFVKGEALLGSSQELPNLT